VEYLFVATSVWLALAAFIAYRLRVSIAVIETYVGIATAEGIEAWASAFSSISCKSWLWWYSWLTSRWRWAVLSSRPVQPCRSERIAKSNRLLEIEAELGKVAVVGWSR